MIGFIKFQFVLNEVKPLCYNYVCFKQLWDLFEWHINPKMRTCLPSLNSKNRKSTQAILIVGGMNSQKVSIVFDDFQYFYV